MKMRKHAWVPVLLCALALLLTMPAFAAQRTCSLTLTCSAEGSPVSGVVCKLYRVADLNGTAFTLTDSFSGAQVQLSGLKTDTQWQTAADSLAVYASADVNKLTPERQGSADSTGTIAFADLPVGLYLAVFESVSSGQTTYHFAPDLLALPHWESDGNVQYSVTAAPKGTATHSDGGGGSSTTEVTVLKIWNDEESQKRPASISVTLLRDDKSYDRQTLTEENNWRFHWTGLPGNNTWSVLETDVPDGYTVSYTTDGTVLTITNQSTTNIPETPTPTGGVTPPTPTPGKPDTGTTIPGSPTPKSGKLPQTGQLWWPVPVLAVAGLAAFAAGWRRRGGDDRES